MVCPPCAYPVSFLPLLTTSDFSAMCIYLILESCPDSTLFLSLVSLALLLSVWLTQLPLWQLVYLAVLCHHCSPRRMLNVWPCLLITSVFTQPGFPSFLCLYCCELSDQIRTLISLFFTELWIRDALIPGLWASRSPWPLPLTSVNWPLAQSVSTGHFPWRVHLCLQHMVLGNLVMGLPHRLI